VSLVSGSSESVVTICIVVDDRLIEASELSPCNIDRICSENTVMCRC
jgi:hypothetical protein